MFTILKRKKPNNDASALILILTNKKKTTIARTKNKKPTIAATPSGSLTVRNCFPDSKLQIRLELDLFVSIFSGPIPVLVDYNRMNVLLSTRTGNALVWLHQQMFRNRSVLHPEEQKQTKNYLRRLRI